MSDGQALDWVDLEPLLPERIEILDFYHVTGRLAEVAVAMHGGAGTAASAWSAEMKQELLDWGARRLLEALRNWKPQDAAGREVRRLQLAYFERHEERLRWKPGTADPLMRVRAALLTQPRLDLRPYAAAGATRGREAHPAA